MNFSKNLILFFSFSPLIIILPGGSGAHLSYSYYLKFVQCELYYFIILRPISKNGKD